MRSGVLFIGLLFSGFSEPLERIGLTQHIIDDGLTKDNFIQRVIQVKRGVYFILDSLSKIADISAPTEQFDEGFIN
jgi:hypothetical protein